MGVLQIDLMWAFDLSIPMILLQHFIFRSNHVRKNRSSRSSLKGTASNTIMSSANESGFVVREVTTIVSFIQVCSVSRRRMSDLN